MHQFDLNRPPTSPARAARANRRLERSTDTPTDGHQPRARGRLPAGRQERSLNGELVAVAQAAIGNDTSGPPPVGRSPCVRPAYTSYTRARPRTNSERDRVEQGPRSSSRAPDLSSESLPVRKEHAGDSPERDRRVGDDRARRRRKAELDQIEVALQPGLGVERPGLVGEKNHAWFIVAAACFTDPPGGGSAPRLTTRVRAVSRRLGSGERADRARVRPRPWKRPVR